MLQIAWQAHQDIDSWVLSIPKNQRPWRRPWKQSLASDQGGSPQVPWSVSSLEPQVLEDHRVLSLTVSGSCLYALKLGPAALSLHHVPTQIQDRRAW